MGWNMAVIWVQIQHKLLWKADTKFCVNEDKIQNSLRKAIHTDLLTWKYDRKRLVALKYGGLVRSVSQLMCTWLKLSFYFVARNCTNLNMTIDVQLLMHLIVVHDEQLLPVGQNDDHFCYCLLPCNLPIFTGFYPLKDAEFCLYRVAFSFMVLQYAM